ncbi:unnamed protein product [Effrenium voratum]|uniref:Pentatricopeptide repeat-containing protein, chloroplastic n=1 Tax=Effrenium voratum TaxID=2562239 RepID=A0AA36MJP7_9DINO|nr:unnamed protein product [Effrenium voratum]
MCVPTRALQHPCPRKLHHPNERCGCAARLSLLVPHGHSRLADSGSLHAARLQNLRWRLTSAALLGRFQCSEGLRKLPDSLRALADDHKGAAACKAQRPLSPERKPRRSLRESRRTRISRVPSTEFTTPESPEVIDLDPPSTVKTRVPCVTFNEELNSEVPLITPTGAKAMKPLKAIRAISAEKAVGAIAEPFDITSRKEMLARRNLRALTENHRVILQQCQHCFSFLKSLSPAQRARCSLRYVGVGPVSAPRSESPQEQTGEAKAARRAGKQSDTCGPHPLATCVRSMVSRHILAELCKSRALRQACQLLETAKLGTGRPRSQAIGLNLVLSALSQEARWQEALHLLTTCQADVVSFTSVITACRARWQTALRLLERMGHQRIAADGVAQNAAGSACERASSWPRCIALASDGVGASVAVSACVRVRAWRPGLALLRRSAAVDSAAATPLLRAWRLGAELLSWLRHARVRPDALARERFGHACAEETCWQLALHLRTGLHGYPLAAWRSAAALAAGGSSPLFASKAMSLCAKARQWSLAVSLLGGRPVDTAMCAAAMSPESAEGLLQLLRQRGLRLGAAFCTALASARSSAGWRAAGSLLTRLEAWAVLPGTILWNVKMADCAWPRAAAVFERLPSASLSADEATWSGLAAACGKSGLWHLASQLLRQMRKLSLERSYVTAACAASCEDWRWALSAAGEATAPEAVLAALARSSRWSRALQVTSREGPLSAGHALNQICLNSLVFACGSAGRWQLATSLSPLDQVGASAAIGATNCPWQARKRPGGSGAVSAELAASPRNTLERLFFQLLPFVGLVEEPKASLLAGSLAELALTPSCSSSFFSPWPALQRGALLLAHPQPQQPDLDSHFSWRPWQMQRGPASVPQLQQAAASCQSSCAAAHPASPPAQQRMG